MELKGKVEEEEVKEEAKRIHSMELKAMLLPVFCPISNPMLEFIQWN